MKHGTAEALASFAVAWLGTNVVFGIILLAWMALR